MHEIKFHLTLRVTQMSRPTYVESEDIWNISKNLFFCHLIKCYQIWFPTFQCGGLIFQEIRSSLSVDPEQLGHGGQLLAKRVAVEVEIAKVGDICWSCMIGTSIKTY